MSGLCITGLLGWERGVFFGEECGLFGLLAVGFGFLVGGGSTGGRIDQYNDEIEKDLEVQTHALELSFAPFAHSWSSAFAFF